MHSTNVYSMNPVQEGESGEGREREREKKKKKGRTRALIDLLITFLNVFTVVFL